MPPFHFCAHSLLSMAPVTLFFCSPFAHITCRTHRAKLSMLVKAVLCHNIPLMNGTVGKETSLLSGKRG